MLTILREAVAAVKSQIRAFTLIESLLVLAITSFIIVLFSTSLSNVVHLVRGELFVAQFEQLYKNTQFQAAATGQKQALAVTSGQLSYLGKQLKVPTEVDFTPFSVKFDEAGNNSSLQKIKIYLPYEHKNVVYQLEIGSGKYKKTIN